MQRVLIIEHAPGRADGFLNYASEHNPRADLVVWHCYETDNCPTTDFSGLIIGGGPMMVGDFIAGKYPFFSLERDVILRAVERDIPTLGICLGSEILCHLYGGEVRPQEWVIGWHEVILIDKVSSDPLMANLNRFVTFQFHRDHFLTLPTNAISLAGSATTPVEAFRLNENRQAWACIFHPEIEVRQALKVFDSHPDQFLSCGVDRHCLSPLDDGRQARHLLMRNFFSIVSTNVP